LKALSKHVQDRFTTAKDMAEEVLRAIESNKNQKPDLVDFESQEARGFAGGMLETVTAILSILEKAIKMLDLAEWRRKDRLNELGTELFLIESE
jgi:hypothetical protein